MAELKECPFCGSSKAKIDSKNSRTFSMELKKKVDNPTYSVRCNKCFARGSTSKNKEDAIEKWNNRK